MHYWRDHTGPWNVYFMVWVLFLLQGGATVRSKEQEWSL